MFFSLEGVSYFYYSDPTEKILGKQINLREKKALDLFKRVFNQLNFNELPYRVLPGASALRFRSIEILNGLSQKQSNSPEEGKKWFLTLFSALIFPGKVENSNQMVESVKNYFSISDDEERSLKLIFSALPYFHTHTIQKMVHSVLGIGAPEEDLSQEMYETAHKTFVRLIERVHSFMDIQRGIINRKKALLSKTLKNDSVSKQVELDCLKLFLFISEDFKNPTIPTRSKIEGVELINTAGLDELFKRLLAYNRELGKTKNLAPFIQVVLSRLQKLKNSLDLEEMERNITFFGNCAPCCHMPSIFSRSRLKVLKVVQELRRFINPSLEEFLGNFSGPLNDRVEKGIVDNIKFLEKFENDLQSHSNLSDLDDKEGRLMEIASGVIRIDEEILIPLASGINRIDRPSFGDDEDFKRYFRCYLSPKQIQSKKWSVQHEECLVKLLSAYRKKIQENDDEKQRGVLRREMSDFQIFFQRIETKRKKGETVVNPFFLGREISDEVSVDDMVEYLQFDLLSKGEVVYIISNTTFYQSVAMLLQKSDVKDDETIWLEIPKQWNEVDVDRLAELTKFLSRDFQELRNYIWMVDSTALTSRDLVTKELEYLNEIKPQKFSPADLEALKAVESLLQVFKFISIVLTAQTTVSQVILDFLKHRQSGEEKRLRAHNDLFFNIYQAERRKIQKKICLEKKKTCVVQPERLSLNDQSCDVKFVFQLSNSIGEIRAEIGKKLNRINKQYFDKEVKWAIRKKKEQEAVSLMNFSHHLAKLQQALLLIGEMSSKTSLDDVKVALNWALLDLGLATEQWYTYLACRKSGPLAREELTHSIEGLRSLAGVNEPCYLAKFFGSPSVHSRYPSSSKNSKCGYLKLVEQCQSEATETSLKLLCINMSVLLTKFFELTAPEKNLSQVCKSFIEMKVGNKTENKKNTNNSLSIKELHPHTQHNIIRFYQAKSLFESYTNNRFLSIHTRNIFLSLQFSFECLFLDATRQLSPSPVEFTHDLLQLYDHYLGLKGEENDPAFRQFLNAINGRNGFHYPHTLLLNADKYDDLLPEGVKLDRQCEAFFFNQISSETTPDECRRKIEQMISQGEFYIDKLKNR